MGAVSALPGGYVMNECKTKPIDAQKDENMSDNNQRLSSRVEADAMVATLEGADKCVKN